MLSDSIDTLFGYAELIFFLLFFLFSVIRDGLLNRGGKRDIF